MEILSHSGREEGKNHRIIFFNVTLHPLKVVNRSVTLCRHNCDFHSLTRIANYHRTSLTVRHLRGAQQTWCKDQNSSQDIFLLTNHKIESSHIIFLFHHHLCLNINKTEGPRVNRKDLKYQKVCALIAGNDARAQHHAGAFKCLFEVYDKNIFYNNL